MTGFMYNTLFEKGSLHLLLSLPSENQASYQTKEDNENDGHQNSGCQVFLEIDETPMGNVPQSESALVDPPLPYSLLF